jgi:hypothetical protein
MLLLLALAPIQLGCRVQLTGADEPVRSSKTGSTRVGSLPAGLYLRNGYLESAVTEQGWPLPTHAILLEGPVDEAGAAEAMDGIPAGALDPGYPLVVHTDELGLVDPGLEGIVLVVSLQESLEKAEAWLAGRDVEARIEPLLDEEGYWKRLGLLDDSQSDELSGLPRFMVVQVDAGDPTPAFARDRVDGVMEGMGDRCKAEDLHDVPPWPELCQVRGGAVFLMDVRQYQRGHWYHWAPVTCEGADAYVSWRATRLGTVILPSGPAAYRMIQVGGASCDMPCYCEWEVDGSGIKVRDGTVSERCDCPPVCGTEVCS